METSPNGSGAEKAASTAAKAKAPDVASASGPDTLAALHVNPDTGLTQADVVLRRKESGYNEVAEHKGHIAGSLMGIICEELYGECRPFLVIEDVIVDNESRHKGIGSALIRKIENCAISRNCNYIIFVTESERTDALPFYESLGYSPDAYRGFKKRLGRQAERSLPQHRQETNR